MKTKNPVTLFTSNLAEIEIFYRNKVRLSDMEKVAGSRDVYDVLQRIWSDRIDHVEEFMVLCLNRANRILGWAKISQGGLSGTVADPKVIFQVALKSNACSLILAHNHPSGNGEPSREDIDITKQIAESGKIIGIPCHDHIIFADDSFTSFAERGLL